MAVQSFTASPRVLIAEDDDEMRRMLERSLSGGRFAIEAVADGRRAIDRLTRGPVVDLVITDVSLPGASGLEILAAARAIPAPPPVIVVTALGDDLTHRRAWRLGATAVLDKPFDFRTLRGLVASILPDELRELRRKPE